MKIKIFYLIFLLKFVFYSCTSVLYYSELIKKYSDEVKADPPLYQGVGFILDISDFTENEQIYFRISLNEKDTIDEDYNLEYYINFESTFDTTVETSLSDFKSIKRKETIEIVNGITHYYFETTKNDPNLNFLKFVIVTNFFFRYQIGFKNTKKDESKNVQKTAKIFIIICIIVFILVIGFSIAACCVQSFRRKRKNAILSQQQMYTQEQIYNQQQMYGQQQMYDRQQMYGQQQMNGQQIYSQQQMYGQQGVNLENNMNVQNNEPNSITMNPNEITPINKKEN